MGQGRRARPRTGRPAPIALLYHRYFDTTLDKAITFNGTNWVDCTGTSVEAPSIITSGLIFALAMSRGLGADDRRGAWHERLSPAGLDGRRRCERSRLGDGRARLHSRLDRRGQNAAAFSDTGWQGAVTVMVVARVDTGGSYRMFMNKESLDLTQNNPIAFGASPDATPKLFAARANSQLERLLWPERDARRVSLLYGGRARHGPDRADVL